MTSAHAAHVPDRLQATWAELVRRQGLSDQKIKKGTFLRIDKLSFWESAVKICDIAGTPNLDRFIFRGKSLQNLNGLFFRTKTQTVLLKDHDLKKKKKSRNSNSYFQLKTTHFFLTTKQQASFDVFPLFHPSLNVLQYWQFLFRSQPTFLKKEPTLQNSC